MILAAIDAGLSEIGISDHSYTSFDQDYCLLPDKYNEYIDTLSELKDKYKDRINVAIGIEYDYYSDDIPDGIEYVIGSVHCLKIGEDYLILDMSEDLFKSICTNYFGGDYYSLCECYYETISDLYVRTRADIVGHFDIVTKYNEGNALFDENNERYRIAWQSAMLKILPDIKCFEINYGAVNKGLRSVPYLSSEMQAFLVANGGYTIKNSDSHSTATVGKFRDSFSSDSDIL